DSVTATEVDAAVRATDVGVYLDAELRPLSRASLRGGVRADGLSFASREHGASSGAARTAQGQHVGVKGTAEVILLPGLRATASYGQGFRSRQARSLGDGEQTPFTRVESQEVGVRFSDGSRLSGALAGYRTTLSEDLVFDETTSRNEGVPGTLRLGLVGDLVAEPVEWFTSTVGFTYTHATFRESSGPYEEGGLVPFVPQIVARTELGVNLPVREVGTRALVVRAGLGSTALFRRPIPFGEFGSDVMLVDLLAAARLAELELALEVWNLFDRAWNDGEFVYASNFRRGDHASALPVRHVTVGAPRQLMLSLSLRL
ncbi:MAG TPA: TonB-dependent receptor, partial [Polyangiaceae bacterium]